MTITPLTIAFAVFAICALGGSLGVVSSRNLVHAALYLVLALVGVAGFYILLEAPFLAAMQILVYVGAIAVLITITIMVTRRIMGIAETVNRQWPVAALAALLVVVMLGFVLLAQFGGATPASDVPPDTIERIGREFVNHQGFLLPFEVASVLLLAALIGAIVVARES
ncbi:MAG: NADH-quinone oxidoreductase subunit J [Anaerolineae bacterium]